MNNVVSAIGSGQASPAQAPLCILVVDEDLPPTEVEMPKNALFTLRARQNGPNGGGLEYQYRVKLRDGRTAIFALDPGSPEPQPGVWVPLEENFGIIRAITHHFVFINCRWDSARGYRARA